MAGISGIGTYVPKRRLALQDYASVWKNHCFIEGIDEFGMRNRSVLASDEDSNTLMVMAAKAALSDSTVSKEDIGVLYLGSRTGPYATRPSATFVAEALGLSSQIPTCDILAGNRSGTAALISGLALVDGAMASHALVVAGDTLGRRAEPGSLQDAFGASGAAGFVLSMEAGLVNVMHVFSGVDIFGKNLDFESLRCNRIAAEDSVKRLQTAEDDLIDNLAAVVRQFFASRHLQPQDFSHAVLPQPYGRFANRLGAALGFDYSQLRIGLVAPEIGDCGGASVFIGLSAVLDSARPGEMILLASHDAGTYDIVCLEVAPTATVRRGKTRLRQHHLYSEVQNVDYATAMKYEQKFCKVPFELNAFM